MNAKARTNSGCWTCRIRHKKCDERPKACNNCKTLGLDCDGYGRKPDWMDGSVRESGYLRKVKAKVRETNARRKRARYQRHQSISSTSNSIPTPPDSAISSSNQSVHVEDRRASSFNSSTSPLCTELPDNDLFASISEITSSQVHEFDTITSNDVLSLSSALSPSPQALEFPSESRVQDVDPNCCNGIETGYRCNSICCATCSQEADMILGYLHRTIQTQFPFYSATNYAKRGWIYLLLKRSTIFHFATVSLSAYDAANLHVGLPNGIISEHSLKSSIAARYSVLALQGLQDRLRNMDSECETFPQYNLEILASIMQLLFCDVGVPIRQSLCDRSLTETQ